MTDIGVDEMNAAVIAIDCHCGHLDPEVANVWVVDTKKRYGCFVGTDLDFVLKSQGVNTLFIAGINTNSCVLATVAAANVRDYAPIVVEDGVDTMDGPELHAAALLCIRTALGWVMTSEHVVHSLLEGAR